MKFQAGCSWGQLTNATSGVSVNTFALNGALSGGFSGNWLAFGFMPLLGGTVSKIRVYINAVTGTLGATDLVCDIYSDSAGNPNTSLQSSSTVTSTPSGAGWVEFTGFSTALTVGTSYWIMLRNQNATPTTNYASFSYLATDVQMGTTNNPAIGQALAFSSTNSGSTWTRNLSTGFCVIDYGSGNTEGFPMQTVSSSDPQIYASREGGVKFTTPSNADLNVIGVCGLVAKAGTPTGDLRFRIYTGSGTSPTLAGTTATRPAAAISTGRSQKVLYFSSPITIPAGSVIRVVASETTQSDTSTNRYSLEYVALSSTDTSCLMPFASNPEHTLSTDGGANFTDTANRWVAIWLVLDASAPFTATGGGGGGGGGIIVHPGMTGGMRG